MFNNRTKWTNRLHTQIEEQYVQEGWHKTGLRKYIREQCDFIEDYDKEYILDNMNGIQPDLWRHFQGPVYGMQLCEYVNVFDLVEVVVSNDISEDKMNKYYFLWQCFDNTDNCQMRLSRVDDTGYPVTIMANNPFEDEVFGRRHWYKISNTDPGFMCSWFGWSDPRWL